MLNNESSPLKENLGQLDVVVFYLSTCPVIYLEKYFRIVRRVGLIEGIQVPVIGRSVTQAPGRTVASD